MNLIIGVILLVVLGWTLVHAIPDPGIDKMAESKSNAVVLIVNGKDLTQPGQSGLGTGFVIGDNLIVTNHHVIANGDMIAVRGKTSQKPYKAKLIASDEFSDIALIKLEDWKDFVATNLPDKLEFSSSRDLEIGSKVWSIGHPWGLDWSVSQGVVSSPSRRLDGNPNYLIQTDTRIFQGNSGGPLLDEYGNVVGINVKMLANTGGSFGFAIPSDLAIRIIEDLKTNGKVQWAVLGIKMSYTEDGKNVQVKEVSPGSAAEKAGIMAGDIILNIVTPHAPVPGVVVNDTDQLLDEMAVADPDDMITLLIKRGSHVSSVAIDPDSKASLDLMPKDKPTNK